VFSTRHYNMIHDTIRYDTMMCYEMWNGMIWYDIYDIIRYDRIRHDMIRYIWYMIRYMVWYMTWYDMIWWCDMTWRMIRCDIWWYDIWYDMIYNMIYLLTAIWLTPGGSSTVHIYTQTIHRTTQWKQKIQNRTYITIRILKHNNKNT